VDGRPFKGFRGNSGEIGHVDYLCFLLAQQTNNGAKLGKLYFESLATALVIAIVSQTDSRMAEAGNIYVQNERVQQALAYIESNIRSKLTLPEIAAAAQLSVSHFSIFIAFSEWAHRRIEGSKIRGCGRESVQREHRDFLIFTAIGRELSAFAIALWNTVYLESAILALRQQQPIDDALIKHLSPLAGSTVI
jgi:hypothetical protein